MTTLGDWSARAVRARDVERLVRVLRAHRDARRARGARPWRRAGSPALGIPRRDGLVTLVIEELPRSGPFRLDAGRRALALAHDATARALDRVIADGVVRA